MSASLAPSARSSVEVHARRKGDAGRLPELVAGDDAQPTLARGLEPERHRTMRGVEVADRLVAVAVVGDIHPVELGGAARCHTQRSCRVVQRRRQPGLAVKLPVGREGAHALRRHAPAHEDQGEGQRHCAHRQSPLVGVRVPGAGRRAAGTPNWGVAQRYSSVSASGGMRRPAKFSRTPARLRSAAPNPAVASSQVTRNAAPRISSPATGTQPKMAHANQSDARAASPTSR